MPRTPAAAAAAAAVGRTSRPGSWAARRCPPPRFTGSTRTWRRCSGGRTGAGGRSWPRTCWSRRRTACSSGGRRRRACGGQSVELVLFSFARSFPSFFAS